MPSESSKVALNGIMKALETDAVRMIGLYGMEGVGKATLAEEVGKQARQKGLFNKVVIFTVSPTPNIGKIQDRIAEILGLKFQTNTEKGKAEELWRRLKGEQKKILIVADDVWKEIKLQAIGIPFGGEHDCCKVLLTTRDRQVCVKMNCQEKFKLDILSEDEALALLKHNAGLEHISSTLNDVAKEIGGECKGLPRAIVTMGKGLRGESLDGWKAAKRRLKESGHLRNQDICEDGEEIATMQNVVDVRGLAHWLTSMVEEKFMVKDRLTKRPINKALVTALANATPQRRRTLLGQNLYPLVKQLENDNAPKVTGMLLEMDQTEILHLLDSPEALKAKVAEAMEVLAESRLKTQALATALANAAPEQRRELLGENLYPLVKQVENVNAPKVTGMLLEMDETEVLRLLDSPEALKATVAEAAEVLRNAGRDSAATASP